MFKVSLDDGPLSEITKEIHRLQMVPIGKTKGVAGLNNAVFELASCGTQKDEIEEMSIGCMKAEKKWLDKAKLNAMFMPIIFWFASSFMEFLPIHFSKVRPQHLDDIKSLKD